MLETQQIKKRVPEGMNSSRKAPAFASYACNIGAALAPSKCPEKRPAPRELPRPLLKYARQASLVEQPTLPGLGLQYCCSSCA